MTGRAYVLMTWELLPVLLGDTHAAVSSLPMDAKVEHVVLDPDHRQMRVYLVSDEFAPVPEGGLIPQFDPTWVPSA